jgi:hypothetical protein
MAIVVTANASSLEKDLDKAEKKVGSFAKGAEKKAESSGAGMMAFAGGFAGAIAGVVVSAVGKLPQVIGKVAGAVMTLREDAAKLGVVFDGITSANIEQAGTAIGRMQGGVMELFGAVVSALQPAITAMASEFLDLLESWKPGIAWLAEHVGTFLTYGFKTLAGIIRIVAGQAAELFSTFMGFLGEDFFGKFTTWGEAAKKILHGLAVGFAYIWDTLKALAGISATFWGTALMGVEKLLTAINWVIRKVNDLTGTKWKVIDDDVIAGIGKVGRASALTGMKMISDWGKTRKAVDELFANMDDKVGKLEKRLPMAYSPVAAAQFGSKEAASIVARFEGGNQLNPQVAVAKEQLQQEKEINGGIKKMVELIAGRAQAAAGLVEVI